MNSISKLLLFGILSSSISFAASFEVSGEAEASVLGSYKQVDPRAEVMEPSETVEHAFESTLDLLLTFKWDKYWGATAAFSADGDGTAPVAAFDGIAIMFTPNDKMTLTLGDLSFAEGAFRYYDYDDTQDYAAGMMDHDVRGVQFDFESFTAGLGLGVEDSKTYMLHLAYSLNFMGQTIRPYFNFLSHRTGMTFNEIRTGLVNEFVYGETFNAQLVYSVYKNGLKKGTEEWSHAITFEPGFQLGGFSVKLSGYYALVYDQEESTAIDAPEYAFVYVEPGVTINPKWTVGFPLELHTMTLDKDASLEQFLGGPKVYFTPIEPLAMEAFVRLGVPLGEDYTSENDSPYVVLGLDIAFTF